MKESTIEAALVKRIKDLGGLCLKFTSPGRRSVPDRIVMLPRGKVIFVEVKAPGLVPTPAQVREHKRYLDLGCKVVIVNRLDALDYFFPMP